MSEALPAHAYGDPANHVKFASEEKRTASKSCATCEHQIRAWELTACGVDMKPGRAGYCKAWKEKA